MSDAPENPKKFRLSPGDAFAFSNGEREAVTWPEFTERPEVELLGRLKEAGADFPDDGAALEIIRDAVLHQPDSRADGRQIIVRFIDWITTGKTVNQSGVMSHVLAFIYQRSSCRTQSELADKLEISQGRVSQLINQIGQMVENIGEN